MEWHLAKHKGVLEMTVLCFSVQEEDIIKHTNAECHVFTLMGNLLTIM